ncbi:ribonuclease HII [Candidatus Micrarchaeota archaeon RBG_16_49_10]|nr:MAG: ribonuclease HII [Candidatus Micrarchaeota archaeon RBG_16_49_10]
MVLCGLAVRESQQSQLKELGVKDSKMLTPKRREFLAKEIEKIAEHTIVFHVPPCKIDSDRAKGINLNQIEAIRMADIINMVQPDKAIIDTPSYNSDKFESFLRSKLDSKDVELVCENYADKNWPVVSAASIVAKVSRDDKIKKLEKKVGEPLGVGYPHDELTIKHLEKLARDNNGKMPDYVRKSWDTTEQIIKKYKQKGLKGFFGKKKEPC